MAWINTSECEAYCYAIDKDYKTIREAAAALYRRFLEKAEGHKKTPRKPWNPPGHPRITTFKEKTPRLYSLAALRAF
jgi:hypothetical protein